MRLKKYLAFISLILICGLISAESYKGSYTGGLNVAFDSTDLAPNEAITMQNLTLEFANVATSRDGWTVFNKTQIDTFPIQNIFFYEPYPDTFRFVIACNGFIYIAPSLAVAETISVWDDYRLGFSDDSLYVVNGSNLPYRPSPSWWYARVSGHDVLAVSDTELTISYVLAVTDTILYLQGNYPYSSAMVDYTIYKRYAGTPTFEQFDNKLYISSDWGFPVVYDDTTYQFLCLVDTGQVDASLGLEADYSIYDKGLIQMLYGSNIAKGNDDTYFGWSDSSGLAGDGSELLKFNYLLHDYRMKNGTYVFFTRQFVSPIVAIDSANNTLTLADAFDPVVLEQVSPMRVPREYDLNYRNYSITSKITPLNFDADSAIVDGSKNWLDNVHASRYLTNLYLVSGQDGFAYAKSIYGNGDSTLQITQGSTEFDNDYYYIFTNIPYSSDSLSVGDLAAPSFYKIEFKNNQLFAFGGQKQNTYTRAEYNRIWVSDINMPFYIKSNYGFELDADNKITGLFSLKNFLYATSNNSIYFMNGIADTDDMPGNLEVQKISDNIGVNDLDNWCPASIENAYFIDELGTYRFNGVRPDKFSYQVDALLDKYWQSECVLGYFDQQLYISFPDSGVTLCYDERYDKFYGLFDFGISVFNHQSDELNESVFYFANPDYDGYIFYYPNDVYRDSLVGSAVDYTCQYKSGWQSFGGLFNEELNTTRKQLISAILDIQTQGSVRMYVYVDSGSTSIDTVSMATADNHIYLPLMNGNCVGERFQFEITTFAQSLTGGKVIFRPYEVIYEWAAPKID